MPRRHQDDDYDDEDDFDGYNRPRRAAGGNGAVTLVVVGLVAAVILGSIALFTLRSRRAVEAEHAARDVAVQAEAESIRQQQQALAVQSKVGRVPLGTTGANWNRVIGSWQRGPTDVNDTSEPIRLEFREDRTAVIAFQNAGGTPRSIEAKVEVFHDHGDSLAMRLHFSRGMYSYGFRFLPDDTLVLKDTPAGMEVPFARVK